MSKYVQVIYKLWVRRYVSGSAVRVHGCYVTILLMRLREWVVPRKGELVGVWRTNGLDPLRASHVGVGLLVAGQGPGNGGRARGTKE